MISSDVPITGAAGFDPIVPLSGTAVKAAIQLDRMAPDRLNDHRSAFTVKDSEKSMERMDAMRVFAITLEMTTARLTAAAECPSLRARPARLSSSSRWAKPANASPPPAGEC
jgi:hypothetical protein